MYEPSGAPRVLVKNVHFFYYNEMNVLYFSSIFIYLTFCLFLGYFIELNYISEIVVIHLTPFCA